MQRSSTAKSSDNGKGKSKIQGDMQGSLSAAGKEHRQMEKDFPTKGL